MKAKWTYFIGGILLIAILSYIISVGIFKSPTRNTQNNKIKVSTSFYPLYYFASEIGGDKAEVKNITPAGTEPHEYEPTSQDIARIENSSLLILNGGVEAWGDKIKENLKGTNVKIVIVGEGLLTKEITEEGEAAQDPHIWLDPKLVKKEVKKITEGYIEVDPANSNFYKNNQKQLDVKLDQLDLMYEQGLKNCATRDFITSHEAFAYLAQRYNLSQISISGLSPDEEPSSQQLAEVADFARKNNVKYIFFETLVSPKLSETIANEVGAQTLVLDPIEGLSDDDIAQGLPAGQAGKNYFTVMEDNLKNLQIALECSK